MRTPEGADVAIDTGIADMISTAWAGGLATRACCQGFGPDCPAYIAFAEATDAARFAELVGIVVDRTVTVVDRGGYYVSADDGRGPLVPPYLEDCTAMPRGGSVLRFPALAPAATAGGSVSDAEADVHG